MTQAPGPCPPLPQAAPERHGFGPLSVTLLEGDLRRVTFHGVEVLRRLSYPIRDASWGTLPVTTVEEVLTPLADGFRYRRAFIATDGSVSGVVSVVARTMRDQADLTARLVLQPLRDSTVNRAGFTLLHPLNGVSDAPIDILHPDGSVEPARLPLHISAGQTAFQIAGLRHRIGGISVDIGFTGEVFEMEDQRNWSDASFKTYCRPLSAPRPYDLTAADPVEQEIVLRVTGSASNDVAPMPRKTLVQMPQVALAHEAGLATLPALARFAGLPVLARISSDTDDSELAFLASRRNVTLEIIADDTEDLATLAGRCRASGLIPDRAIALPRSYLTSHQPEGPWPPGCRPDDLVAVLRQAFPLAEVGGGSLTHFTEFNRCPPDAASIDFVTFGNSAIVHAADDMSVLETLETFPHIFASAAALSGGKPMRLGLMSIAMRSNPYGAAVVPNPGLARLPMAMDDPRQKTAFAAAYAVGVLAAASHHGVAALALGMADGPLGILHGPDLTPLGEVVDLASRMSGEAVLASDQKGLVMISGRRGGMIANLSDAAQLHLAEHALRLHGATGMRRVGPGEVVLRPQEVALWQADGS